MDEKPVITVKRIPGPRTYRWECTCGRKAIAYLETAPQARKDGQTHIEEKHPRWA